MSRGGRTPPSAQTCRPSSRAAAAHSSTAENCGRPTPVIIRGVHMAPGPTPTFTTSAPAPAAPLPPSAPHVNQSPPALGGDQVARHDRHPAGRRPDGANRLDGLLLV